ncbi:histidine kinase [Labrenzia sp. CP4]|jgi:putative two-component system response regulator|uniref:HD domain-containing phosphohydrolase n=1 Tax=Labrenzia sp. CP4 TaxID=1674922 RepID=UPI000781913B|nr:HD domain-containing phosphohydrolase [Labrenzia sp. CP4]AMN52623.1 histidine kinase [Labrenzia sp. CP4]
MTDTPLADTEFRILLVEDDPTNRMIMERLVERIPGCHAVSFAHPIDLIAALDMVEFDVAIVDYQLPGLNGIELIKEIHQHPAHTDKPMVIVTADKDRDTRIEALTSGAVDFLNKPLEIVEFKARVRNLTKLAEAQRKLSMRAEWLKEEVDRATTELRKRGEEIVHRLILASEYKDLDTAMHTLRMANFCELIAEELGMSMEFRRDLKMAAPMHDIGKVGIPDRIMLKRGPLTPEEREEINRHTEIGAGILKGSSCRLLQVATQIAATHHERWDGSGYPNGLRGEEIPLVGRIAAVADVFDALTTERPYKSAWTNERAFSFLEEKSGSDFDPECIAAFLSKKKEVEEIQARFADEPIPLAKNG